MELMSGTVVKSMAGRDKGLWFVVLETEGDCAFLVDGKLRPLENPKRKKEKHLQKTKKSIPLASLSQGNRAIRLALQEAIDEEDSEL